MANNTQRSTVLALVVAALACSLPAAHAAGRTLQQDALSNSNGCITSGAIPKCEAGACATAT